MHSEQMPPQFLGARRTVSDVGEPNLIGPLGGEFLVEPVGGDRQIVMAVGGAYPESPRRYCSDALVTHEASDAATARHIPPGAQGRVDPGRTVPAAMRGMDPPNLGQQGTIGRLARTFGSATPSIIPRRRDAHHIAHDANRECLALIRDEAEFHLGASEKICSVFLRNGLLGGRHLCCLQNESEGLGTPM
jgi:hypothetical protein